jgi:hypothetical protein
MSKIANFKGRQSCNGFKQNKSNINRSGRPRSHFVKVNNSLKEQGYESVSKKELLELYSLLLSLDESKVKELIADDTAPYVVRLILKEFLGKNGGKVIKDMIDYVFGKATQQIGHSAEVKEQSIFFIELPTKM